MTWMLKLYPHTWRQRYGAELEELVASQPRSLQLFVDLLGGAVDAHWKPQALAQRMESATSAEGGGANMFTRLRSCCAAERMSRKEAFQGAALTIGAALVLVAMMFVWRGPEAEAVAMTMFPGVLVLGMQSRYLRGHSTVAKVVLIGGMFLVLFGIGLLATLF